MTINEMPTHNHLFERNFEGLSGGQNWSYRANQDYIGGQMNTNNAGNNQPHNNLQPYITCYIYKRVK